MIAQKREISRYEESVSQGASPKILLEEKNDDLIKQSNNQDLNAKKYKSNLENRDREITQWFKSVYNPIDRLIGEIIRPLPKQLKDLSGDPYDENLMDEFFLCFEEP